MTPWHRIIGGCVLFGCILSSRAAGPYGTDVGWTVDHNSGQIDFTSTLANRLTQGEVGWVRVEVALVSGHTNWDSTMLGYYDTVVNNARNAGLQVLMLIDGGSWPGNQANWCANNSENNPGTNGDNPYIEGYATNAVLPLVLHFHDRVKVFELWNEPNAWTSNPSNGVYTGSSFVYPSNFGWLLARSWEVVHGVNHINDVTLFSGGVFGLSSYGTSYSAAGAQYVDDTYSTGTNLLKGGSFAHTKSNYNAYPLDGVGQHIYITQGGSVSSNTFRQYEDWVHQALTKYEGTSSPKKTFITEFGWQTTNSGNANGVSAAIQDSNLVTSFSAILAAPYVQMAIWFNWEDNPAGALWYGVLDSGGNPKVSYADFQHAERFEGIYSNATTNSAIQTYFNSLGEPILGSPYNNGRGPWVTNFLNGYAQDYYGGSHSNLTLMSFTNGAFELNDLYGFWNYYSTNNGAANCGPPTNNAYVSGGGIRQDFSLGYLTWDSVNLLVWHAVNNLPPVVTGLIASPGSQQIALQWNSIPAVSYYKVYTAIGSNSSYALNTTVVGLPVLTDAPLNNGATYFYEVSAVNSYGEGPLSSPANATPESVIGNLPNPWQDGDIGSVCLSGNAGFSASGGGTFDVYGCGADIGVTNDAFNFLHQPFAGNGAILARIKSQAATDPWAKAGVMIRETLATNAAYAMTVLTPSNGVRMQYRALTGGGSTDVAGPVVTAPYWLKVSRNGAIFAASVSSDGTNYLQVSSTNLVMGTNVFAGLAVCSHNTNVMNTSVFDNVTITPQVAPASLSATPGNAQVLLAWLPVAGSAIYDVKRSLVSGGPYAVVASNVNTTNYLDGTVSNGTMFYYVVAATNNAGEGPASIESGALPAAPPQIGAQPQSQTVNQGDSVQFNASASSVVAMTCQWQFNGFPISGAQLTNYSITSVQPGDIGNYAAVFSNYGGSVTSAPALLLVRPLLNMGQNGVLTWTGPYTLQSATNILGPFLDLPGVTSPYTNTASGSQQQFFRLRY